MARSVRDAALETRTARARLKVSAKPYYRQIDEGLHIGYRKGKGSGKWVVRRYLGQQNYRVETIGPADDTLDADGEIILSFNQAQEVARKRFVEAKRAEAGLHLTSESYTVRQCMAEYLTYLEQNRKSARDARWRVEALILPMLGDIECAKLTTKQIRAWKEAAVKASARVRTKKGQAQRYRIADSDDPDEVRRKRRASVNRLLTILKAALNHAWRDDRRIQSDEAWRALEPFEEADSARVRYLTVDEAKRLINASAGHFRDLMHAALLTGCRFGELAALTVGDFSRDSATLHIRSSKSGTGRHVVLTEEGSEFFQRLSAGRSAKNRLLPKADGGKWLKSHQSRPMAQACEAAQIEPPATFHTLRHTYASLAVMNGGPLMVIARNLGHSDTRMVEKHYGHMSASYVSDAIRAAAPRFGIKLEDKTAPPAVGAF